MTISGSFFGWFGLLVLGFSVEFAAARALDADVVADATDCRGLELRSGGDFNGAVSEIYTSKRGLGCL